MKKMKEVYSKICFDELLGEWCEYTISIPTYETDKSYKELEAIWEDIDQQITLLEPQVERALNEFLASSPENEMDWVLEDRLSELEGKLEELQEQRYIVDRQMKSK